MGNGKDVSPVFMWLSNPIASLMATTTTTTWQQQHHQWWELLWCTWDLCHHITHTNMERVVKQGGWGMSREGGQWAERCDNEQRGSMRGEMSQEGVRQTKRRQLHIVHTLSYLSSPLTSWQAEHPKGKYLSSRASIPTICNIPFPSLPLLLLWIFIYYFIYFNHFFNLYVYINGNIKLP